MLYLGFYVYFSVLVLQVDQDEEEGLYLQQVCQHQVTQERLTTIKLNHGKRQSPFEMESIYKIFIFSWLPVASTHNIETRAQVSTHNTV